MAKMCCSRCGSPFQGITGEVCPFCLLTLGLSGEAEKPLEPGEVFHGLEIVDKLGQGGMGVVYKARQPQLDRFVALKILPKALGANEEFKARFAREAKALAALSHPNIVSVHDFGEEDGRHFFVMEFVDGANLRAALENRKLSSREAIKMVPLLCDALEYAHSEGVVHRDIKPENILLDKRGNVKIADFGLVKMLHFNPLTARMTQADSPLGTPLYMAPEQIEDPASVDHRADIYSMGVLFYEMLTGELPVGRFEPPSRRVDVDVRLDEIVLRTLEKQPEKRYQSMGQIREEVREIAQAASRRKMKGSMPGWLKTVAAVVALAVVGFLAFRAGQQRTPEVPPQEKQEKKEIAPQGPWIAAKITADDLPEGWRMAVSDHDEAERTELIEVAQAWWLHEHVKGLARYRPTILEGPEKREIRCMAFECASGETLDACIQVLQSKFLPHPNRFLLTSGLCFVFASANRDGRIGPALIHVEDRLREKLGLKPAVRKDPTNLTGDDLPKGWTAKPGLVGDLQAPYRASVPKNAGDLLGALAGLSKPDANEIRDGWVRSYASDAHKDDRVDVISLRFFESDPVKPFLLSLRSCDPPKGKDMRVLASYNRMVVVLGAPSDSSESAGLSQFVKAYSRKFGKSAAAWTVQATGQAPRLDEQALVVPFELSGVSRYELTRSGSWSVELSGNAWESLTMGRKPSQLAADGGKLKGSMAFPIDAALRRFLETRPSVVDLTVSWREGKGNAFGFRVVMPKAYPASFKKCFGSLFLRTEDLPHGWRFASKWKRMWLPFIATGKERIAEGLRVIRTDPGAVDMLYLCAVEPIAKNTSGFEGMLFALIKSTDPLIARLKPATIRDSKNPLGADLVRGAAGSGVVFVGFLFGSHEGATRTFKKIADIFEARVKARATSSIRSHPPAEVVELRFATSRSVPLMKGQGCP